MKHILFIALFLSSAFLLSAQTPQIEHLQRQQQALQEEIRSTNKLYLDVKKQTTTILDRINLINKQIAARKELITVQRSEIESLRKEESRLEKEIARLNKELKQKQDNYANAIKGMLNHQFSEQKLLYILSGKSPGESLRRMQYLRELFPLAEVAGRGDQETECRDYCPERGTWGRLNPTGKKHWQRCRTNRRSCSRKSRHVSRK